jgi:NitT/TauT family transport system substrate-binding protein
MERPGVAMREKSSLMQILMIILMIALLVTIFATCEKRKGKSAILQREWTANAEFVGDLCAVRLAPEYGYRLAVKEGSELLDPVRQVRVGAAQFGVASADRILQENAGGAELTVIAAATYRTPVVFLVHQDSNIQSPGGFIGKSIGIQVGTNTELVLDALVAGSRLDKNRIRIVDSGWGIRPFVVGDVDVLGAFDYDEPIQLDMMGMKYRKIIPEDYGVKYVGTVYFTSRNLIEHDPDLVQDFVSSLCAGWKEAMRAPDQAINLLSDYNSDVDKAKELKSLGVGIKYFGGEDGRLLFASRERWEAMAASLIQLGKIESFNFEENVDYRFLDKALLQLDKEKDNGGS